MVARALDLDEAEVEERLESLNRVHALVRPVCEHEFPDNTLTLRFTFVHALYQNSLYSELSPARRAQASTAVAEALLSLYGEQSVTIASELAFSSNRPATSRGPRTISRLRRGTQPQCTPIRKP